MDPGPAQGCARLGNKTVPMWYLNKIGLCATNKNPRYPIGITGIFWLRGLDLNQRPSGYEPERCLLGQKAPLLRRDALTCARV